MKRLLFVINPISGGTDKDQFVRTVSNHEKSRQWVTSRYQTSGYNDAEHLRQMVETFNPDTLIAVGGDGTVNLVARAALAYDLPIAIIPSGSSNGLARELNIPIHADKALEKLTEGKTRTIDTLLINEQLVLHFADCGINARVIKRFQDEESRGLAGYLKQYLREFREKNRMQFSVNVKGKTRRHKGIMLIIANARSAGAGIPVNPAGNLDDGRFEILIYKGFPPWYILKILTSWAFKRLNRIKNVIYISTDKAEIKTNKPVPLQTDGEYLGETRQINAHIGKKKLVIFV